MVPGKMGQCAYVNLFTAELSVLVLSMIASAEYSFEVFSVERCPLTKENWETASVRLSCNKSHGYHCVPNKHLTSLIEFCYPLGYKIPFHQGNCLELAADGILNHVPCNTTFTCGCPDKFYFSNDIYKYPMCLSINPLLKCFTADVECVYARSLMSTTMKPHTTSLEGCNDTENMTNVTGNVGVLESNTEWCFAFCVIFAITTIVLCLVVLCLYKRRKNADGGNQMYVRNQKEEISGTAGRFDNDTSDTDEDVPILEQNSRNTSFQVKEPPRKDPKFKRLQSRGFNALHSAAKDGNVDIFKNIFEEFTRKKTIESGVDSRTKDGRNCLHIAAYLGHHDICKHILSKRKNLFESKDNNKMNPAHWAALAGKTDILELMLEYGCDVYEKTNPYEENIVLFACIGNKLEVCKFAEKNCPDLLHAKNREGWNSIQYAAKRGYLEIFDFLYNNMVDIKSKSHKTDKNCLYSACENGHVAVVDYILSKEPELLNKRDQLKQHVGIFAAKSGNSDVLSFLLTKTNMDFLKKASSQKINILHVACKYANLDFCTKLKERHILQDLCQEITEKGWNAALFITERSTNEDKRIKILELLVEDDWLDVYHVSRAGKTILYNACVNQSKKLVIYLLDHYPDLDGIERGLDPIRAAKSDEISAIFERHRRAENSKRCAFFSK